jgi:hypothetical protein
MLEQPAIRKLMRKIIAHFPITNFIDFSFKPMEGGEA